MIYDCIWNHVCHRQETMQDVIKDAPVEDKFIFIVTNTQYGTGGFESFLEKMREYVAYEMPYFITNGSHEEMGRRLKLVVFGKEKLTLKEGKAVVKVKLADVAI